MVGPNKSIKLLTIYHISPCRSHNPQPQKFESGMVCQKIENPPIIHLQMMFPLHPILPPIQGETPSYVWLVGFKPVNYSYIPPINPNVNQVISQLSYNSAANPMKSLIFVS